MATMKTALVYNTPEGGVASKLVDTPVPTTSDLKPDQVLIKVHVSGCNPKDWKMPTVTPHQNNFNTGDDIAGTITAVGSAVTEFHIGDRVAAFHEMMQPWGSYAEYAVAYEHTTFHIPQNTSFEEASTVPLAAMTAVVGLFKVLGVPEPWVVKDDDRRDAFKGGVVIYGAASAVGAFAIKLLNKSQVHPVICVAGRGKDFVEALIDRQKGDTIVDYREGDEAVIKGLKEAIPQGQTLRFALDAVSEHGSYANLGKVLDTEKGSRLALVLPGKNYEGIPKGVVYASTRVGDVHAKSGKEIGAAWYRLFGLGLKKGWFSGHPYEVVEGGLDGVGKGLQRLKNGEVSAKKVVYRVSDTQGIDWKE